MRITDVRERGYTLSRYADPSIVAGRLPSSMVAVVTDVHRGGEPVVGYGFGSVGRFAQGGLIRERFVPRLMSADAASMVEEDGANLDPFKAWNIMMTGEKPGGHGERCVALGAIDMAIWDAAAKIAELPLYRYLARKLGRSVGTDPSVPVYAGGGYLYPDNDLARLSDELRAYVDQGFTRAKIKIGASYLAQDEKRIDAAAAALPGGTACLAVDAMNAYGLDDGLVASRRLAPLGLWWFEDPCDPLDFETQSAVAGAYGGAVAVGEALFSLSEAKLLHQYGGLAPSRDILVFDPVHCYGLPGYLQIVEYLTARGWPRSAFWPHGGHLFCLHLSAALDLGGAEINPFAFQPLCGLPAEVSVADGRVSVPNVPGIGFETRPDAHQLFSSLLGTA